MIICFHNNVCFTIMMNCLQDDEIVCGNAMIYNNDSVMRTYCLQVKLNCSHQQCKRGARSALWPNGLGRSTLDREIRGRIPPMPLQNFGEFFYSMLPMSHGMLPVSEKGWQ